MALNSDQNCVNNNNNFGTTYSEFCQRHARAASSDFARATLQFTNSNLPENVSISPKDFLDKFIECFQENFINDYNRRLLNGSKVSVLSQKIFSHLFFFRISKFGAILVLSVSEETKIIIYVKKHTAEKLLKK